MTGLNRKAAIAAYKERKPRIGIYAVRCGPTGEVWVGATHNLDSRRTSLWFALRQGSFPNPALQAAWNSHGAEAFACEPLEALATEDTDYLRQAGLNDRAEVWRATLSAQRL